MTLKPRAATRLGVEPSSEMRAAIAASANASATSALPSSSTSSASKGAGGASESRAEIEYSSRPSTSTSSRSKAMSALRSMSMPRPVHAMVPRKASSAMAKSGVKRRVSTGAMFSITPCFASTSHAATITAPAAAEGSTCSISRSGSMPIALNMPTVIAVRTPPPSAISA